MPSLKKKIPQILENNNHQKNNLQAKQLFILERLKKQKCVIDSRIQACEARVKTTLRKQETRRKILIGSYYYEQAKKNNTLEELKQIMTSHLTREIDKKLFDVF